MDASVEEYAAVLRARMVDALAAGDHLTNPAWREAFVSVPRHVFLPAFFRMVDGGWESVGPDTVGTAAWLDAVYSNEAWVTQLDGSVTPMRVAGVIDGEPTCSSSMPELMADMVETLTVTDESTVLEIGTGTGYNAALLTARLGAERVTTVEVDGEMSAIAARTLAGIGLSPRLVVGDGRKGYAPAAPYDRIIATCSVPRIPRAWIDQTRPGGYVLATISTRPHGMGQVRLAVAADGSAEGGFVIPGSSFMPARHLRRGSVWIPESKVVTSAPERPADWRIDSLRSWPEDFLAGWVLGDASHYLADEDSPDMVVDRATKAWADSARAVRAIWCPRAVAGGSGPRLRTS